ncbi:MAG TPA: SseB family protein [Elusimicrobiota bacterium]|jgi:hypothetical protein|nr:SseB family protein [Elusimicrobiota bacterium]
MRRAFPAEAGMWALWDAARFARVRDYRAWKRELLHEADLLRHVAAGVLVPVNISSESGCEFEVRAGLPGSARATIRERESQFCAASSAPFLLASSGEACLSAIGDVGLGLEESVARIPLPAGRYSAVVHLLDWRKELAGGDADAVRRPGALPDFLILLNPAAAGFRPPPTLDTFRQDGPPPTNPELLAAISHARAKSYDAFLSILKVMMRSTVILGAQKGVESASLSVPLPEDVEVPLLAVQAHGGKKMLAVFTDLQALEARRPGCGWVAMAGGDALLHALKANFDGIILNPAGPGLEVPRAVLARAV